MRAKRIVVSVILSVFFIHLFGQGSAKFVWKDNNGEGRQVYVFFRKDFKLKDTPKEAKINLYADSRYLLYVNENLINFGPVRCFPTDPEYDTYDIAKYLEKGDNTVSLIALSNGVYTYQQPLSIGGFIAWGEFNDGSNKVSFETPGDWLCKEVKGFDDDSPKMSFACGPMESYNAGLDDQNWKKTGIDTKDWSKVTLIKNQEHWGDFRPRTIPHLTQDEVLPKYIMGMYPLKTNEDIYSFRIKGSDLKDQFNTRYRLFAYTYIHSKKDQDVEAGLWWGEYWLNGDSLVTDFDPVERPVYSKATLHLKKGWNFFFVKYGMVWGVWDFYMALPKSAELALSPTKVGDSDNVFMTAGPFTSKEQEKVEAIPLPFNSPDDLPKLSKTWHAEKSDATAGNPAWEIAWREFESPYNIDQSKISDIDIKPNEGTAIVLDMGGKLLGRIFLDVEAPEGTVFDIGFSEDMRGEKTNVLKRAGVYTAVRFVAREGQNKFETFKPYGIRYLQINIMNESDKPVKINKVGVISQIYPYIKTGSFECSDPMFNSIWKLGWRTLRVCSEDTYIDTPFRERGTYAGDALPEFAITLATTGDPMLMKRSLLFFQGKYRDRFYPDKEKPVGEPGLLSDFPFITLLFYSWYLDWTGDIEFAEELYPAYKYLVDAPLEHRLENGLIDNGRCFIEWTRIEKKATLTPMQALYAQSLELFAHVANTLGKEKDAEKYTILANELKQIISDVCWDSEKGAYRDGFYKKGGAIDHHYPASSAWPSLYGVTTPEQEKSLRPFYWETLSDIGNRSRNKLATPYGGFYLLGALYKYENADIAEMFIRKYWSPMILRHDDTAWENFDDGSEGDGQGTLSHAWSGGPTYYMSTAILGVPLGFPDPVDWDNIVLSPQSHSINWAKGTVPHPKGIISVDWKICGDKLIYNCSVPKGVNFTVSPKGRLAEYELWVNGEKINK